VTEQPGLFVIGEREGFSPRVGVLVSELANARHFLFRAARDLSVEQLDARPGLGVNSIGQLLAHVAAAETMLRSVSLYGRRFDDAERDRWGAAFTFEDSPWTSGRPLEAYLDDLRAVREVSLAGLREKDDAWLSEPMTFAGKPANKHYYWLHLLQDEARHTGQVILLRKYLIPGADPAFYPYDL
jgi:uncharacterized damage-inducible protein DinB